MNSIVLLKFVPVDAREKSKGLILNPADGAALETALSLAGTEDIVCLLSMGPMCFKELMEEYQARSPKLRSFLISDSAIAGSDTAATSKVLAKAVQTIEKQQNISFDLIFAGRRSTDGETSQVPVETAARLGFPFISNVDGKSVREGEKELILSRQENNNITTYSIKLPAVISMMEYSHPLRPVSLKGMRVLKDNPVVILSLDALGISHNRDWGIQNSRTVVFRSEAISIERKKTYYYTNIDEAKAGIEKAIRSALTEDGQNSERTKQEKIHYRTLENTELAKPSHIMVIGERGSDSTENLLRKAVELADICDSTVILLDKGTENTSDCVDTAKELIPYIRRLAPAVILAPADSPFKDLCGALAAVLDCGLTADCTELLIDENGILTQIRPAAGDSMIASIHSKGPLPQMATVRSGFTQMEKEIEVYLAEMKVSSHFPRVTCFESTKESLTNEPSISDAAVVIAGGAGIENSVEFQKLATFAKFHGIAVAGSRVAVDRGLIPYSRQVGLTGRIIHPKLYIAVAVSGAVQHIVGIRNAKKVIAVNKDPQAAIFRYADEGIVADWREIFTDEHCQ